ncbi:MAG: hypothetical protein QME74_01500 [Candidatus Edwardsbacteria bacterium]|nr:hypothetical protein [Candidatus Edwardsbacteria bacterium]
MADAESQERDAAEMLAQRRMNVAAVLEMSDGDTLANVADKEGGLCERDPSQPLHDARYEAYCCARAVGVVAHGAYHAHVSRSGTVKTATQQASRLGRKADVRARLRWLKEARRALAQHEAASGTVDAGRMSRVEKIAVCETILRDRTVTVTDRMRAMEQHTRLTADEAGDRRRSLSDLDPVELTAYFRLAAEQGIDPENLSEMVQRPQHIVVLPVGGEAAVGNFKNLEQKHTI